MSNKFSSPSLSALRATPQYVPLTDICQPKQWKTIPKAELKTKGYPVYGANGLIGYSDEYNHENKTILIACRGASCGAINVCLPKSYVTGNAMCLDNLNEEFDLDFLQHYLQTYDFKKAISGSAQPQITRSGLSLIMIPILPVSLQRKISCILSAVDENKKQAEQTVKYLDILIKSRFVEMFGEEQRLIELSEVCETFNGDRSSNYPSADERINAGVPFVNAGNLANGAITFNNMEYVSEEKYHQLSGGRIQTGDLLYCLRGSLGKCALADFNKGTIASSLMIIRCNQERIQPKYLYETMVSPFVERQMASANNGSSQPNLSAKSVKQFKIPLPPLALQQEFADFVAQVDKLRFATQQQIDKLETLKKSLMQEYFG